MLISCCDGLLLLLASSRRVSDEERQSVLLEGHAEEREEVKGAFYVARGDDPGRMVSIILIGRNR